MIRGGAFGRTVFVLFLPLLLRGAPLPAQIPDGATGLEAGGDLASEMRSMRPEENSHWQGTLKITRHHKTTAIPVSCVTTLDAANGGWTVIYVTGAADAIGAEKLTVHFSTDKPNRYVFEQAPAPGAPPGAPRELSGPAAEIPLAGSDFWLSDLGMDFYHWPRQERLSGERHGGELCHVLESVNPHPVSGGYSRVKTWIEKESGAPLEAIADGADGGPLKDFKIGSVRKVNGHWEVKDIEMINIRTRSQTHIVFDLENK